MMRTCLSNSRRLHIDWVALVLLTFSVGSALSQENPVSNFCRRWGHQSAVVDDRLYIDGGLVTWSSSQKAGNFSNQYLIYHDLTTSGSSGMPLPYANLSKNSSIPSVNGGVLWPDTVNKRIYLYGGEYFDEKPWEFNLFAYDIINNQWDNYGSSSSSTIRPLSYGAGLSLSDRGEGYYYGGWMSNASDPDWGDNPATLTSAMLRYNMDTNSWTNITGPDNVGRAEGVMTYIPAGDGGMIVYFGGVRDAGNGTVEGQPMDEILLYDILSGKAYTQNATGDVPGTRRRFCAGAVWAEDQSSYNIYTYGGSGEELGSLGFDDLYVLTIPTFEWIRLYPSNTNGTGDFPHHSMTCNIVNEAQMLIHGGFFPKTNDCDSPDQWGLHNVDMGKQNDDDSYWVLYSPNKTSYVVPDDIIDVIGGGADGGATKTAPDDGFDHRDLQYLMPRKATVAARQPTRAIPGSDSGSDKNKGGGLSSGAIAGIAVGGAAALLAGLVVCFCLYRRHKGKRGASSHTSMVQSYQYHHPSQPSESSNQFSGGPWSPQSSHFPTTSPPPSSARPQTVPPHTGPPVELPTSANDEIAQRSPYSETASSREPKYDAQGNLWVPQVSLMQVPAPTRSADGSSTLYNGTLHSPLPSTLKGDMERARSPITPPQELDGEFHGHGREGGERRSATHLTYYHP